MGRVFAATERTSGQRVAIKLLDPELYGDPQRFQAEAVLLERIEHPAIVSYVAHGVSGDGTPYLAMSWLDGESLAERLRRGRLTLAETIALARRVCDALAYLHDRSIVHRDIKPSNILLVGGELSRATVIDLGIAKQLAGDYVTRTGQLVGTPGYMAPEQALGQRDIDGRVDLFALGCVLYESLAGRPPFHGDAPVEALARMLLEEPPLLDHVPRRIQELVATLLAKRPEDRLRDAHTLAVGCERWCSARAHSPLAGGARRSCHDRCASR